MTDFFLGGEGALRPGDAAAALILVGDDERYLMQLRDQRTGIFYPGHWGLFGGSIDPGESPEQTLRRELREELGLNAERIDYLTEFTFDFAFAGYGILKRSFYEVRIAEETVGGLRLGEGSQMRLFSAYELLTAPRIVPFDSFALWLHAGGRKSMKRKSADCPSSPRTIR